MIIKTLNIIFRQSKGTFFLLLYLAAISPFMILVLLYSRPESHILINSLHYPFLDNLMKIWTLIGDGLLILSFVVILLFINIRISFAVLMAFLSGSIIAQLLKHIFFKSMARPLKYFEINNIQYELHLVQGIDYHSWYSFPSGHTTVAFSVCFILALFAKNKRLQLLLLVLAAGVGYSRVYLSQHFLMDVVAGSFLGIISGWVAYLITLKITGTVSAKSIFELLKR